MKARAVPRWLVWMARLEPIGLAAALLINYESSVLLVGLVIVAVTFVGILAVYVHLATQPDEQSSDTAGRPP